MSRQESCWSTNGLRRHGAVALASVGALLASCASDLQPLSVTGFYAIQGTAASESAPAVCSVAQSTQIVSGQYDTALDDGAGNIGGYKVGVSVQSVLDSSVTQPSADSTLRIPSNTAQLTSVTAKYTWTSTNGTRSLTFADAPFPVSAVIPAAGTSYFPVQLMTSEYGKKLKAANAQGTLSVELTFSGTLQDGSSISSTPATFSVNVCSGCVSTCKADQTPTFPCGPVAVSQPDGRVCVANSTTTTGN